MARCYVAGRAVIWASFDRGLPIPRSASSPPEHFPVPCQAQIEPCALPTSGGASTEGLGAGSQWRPLLSSGRSAPHPLPSPCPPRSSAGTPASPRCCGRRGLGALTGCPALRARRRRDCARLCGHSRCRARLSSGRISSGARAGSATPLPLLPLKPGD